MTDLRIKIATVLLAASVGGAGLGSTAASASTPAHALRATHACTRTSTHKCIRGGEFCPASKYHKSGWDARGRRYVCKGSRSHPHWEKP